MAGGYGELAVWTGALERCETGANPSKIGGKRKPVTHDSDSGGTGCRVSNGGGGGS